jgi:hypothetical protein
MNTSIQKIASVIAALWVGLSPALAGDGAWTMSEVKTSGGDEWGAALIATADDGREVGFRCTDGQLLVAFALEPANMMEAFKEAGPQKAVRVSVAINSEDPQNEKWLLLRRHKVIATADRKKTRRIYNAIVRGETVSIDAKKRGGGDYATPAADATAFSSFMDTCGFSAKSEKDAESSS